MIENSEVKSKFGEPWLQSRSMCEYFSLHVPIQFTKQLSTINAHKALLGGGEGRGYVCP